MGGARQPAPALGDPVHGGAATHHMTSFATLQHALAARAAGDEAVHYVVSGDSERRIAYRTLHANAQKLLGRFQRKGVREGAQMILLLDALEPFVDAFWACILGRIAAVPLAVGATDQHRFKLVRVLERLGDPWVITERKTFARVEALAHDEGLDAALARLDGRVLFVEDVASDERAGTPVSAAPGDLAFIQFSSGSTSAPKGVMLTHANLMSNIDAILAGIGGAREGDASLSWMPLTHDMGLIGFHLVPLIAGRSHWLMPTALFVRRPALWMQKASEHRVSVTCSPNFGYAHFLKTFDRASAASLDLTSLRVVFNGAEPIDARLCAEFTAALAPAGLAADVMLPVYGLAEATLAVTIPPARAAVRSVRLARGTLAIGDAAAQLDAKAAQGIDFVKVGAPVDGCELAIADASGARLADGVVGRVLIRGANVTQGYYGDEALTRATIDSSGWLDTGDLGARIDGELVVTGRASEILFAAGQNLYPHDLEDLLARHAGVETGRAAVTGVRLDGTPSDAIVAFVTHKGGGLDAFVPTALAVRRVIAEHAGTAVHAVVPVRQLPKTTSGKLQRFALAGAFARGEFAGVLAELAALESGAPSRGAGSEIERQLLGICQALLPKRVLAADDNLFEIGTSSLTLAQIYERVDAAWPGVLEVTDFFDYPTVRAMAAYLERQTAATTA
jgi:acyl-CoA synthetase (AMP-forming)/AMP-acid ligase II